MKLQRVRFRIIALVILCAFAFVFFLSIRSIRLIPETEDSDEAGNEIIDEEYDEHGLVSPAPEVSPVITIPPADSVDTFGL